ncbi:peptidase M48 [Leptospira ognonensis]|uniref:Peptidase M48 n=1 Tax=Leptospira ognonensis TaxID=2484945 RepID=A0A4R9K8H3_9LEPT|nr:M48 family metalloprotease [Leptospira ognonensis]TGL61776.1 peptidase M48 [Leptospira ognonensis]
MKFSVLYLSLIWFTFSTIHAKSILYVQSPKAKLLKEPQLSSDGPTLKPGETLNPMSEQGLFVQVRMDDKTGWVSKLFVSQLPPSSQIKLGVTSNSTETIVARQRASDFTKTAAARGLSETEKMRVRGGAELYDFEALRWLESLPSEGSESGTSKAENQESSFTGRVSEDTKTEVKMGRALAARLLKKYPLMKDAALTGYLNSVGNQVASISSRRDLSFKFGVLDTEEENALACPGGFIFITKGTLKKIQSESELAGVLGHEIGHITLFHSGKFVGSNVFLDILASLLSPAGGETISAAASAVLDEMETQLFETGRDEKVEWEADEAGVSLAAGAGYGSQGLGNFLTTLAKSKNADHLKKTHPDTSERIAKLIRIEASVDTKGIPLVKQRWNRYKDLLNP